MRKKRSQASNPDAVFLGWQELVTGSPIAIYNVTAAGHPSYGSTVSEETLNKLNLQIPKEQSSNDKESRFDSEKGQNAAGYSLRRSLSYGLEKFFKMKKR